MLVLITESIKITDKQIHWEPPFVILLLWKFVLSFPLGDFILAFR